MMEQRFYHLSSRSETKTCNNKINKRHVIKISHGLADNSVHAEHAKQYYKSNKDTSQNLVPL